MIIGILFGYKLIKETFITGFKCNDRDELYDEVFIIEQTSK
jgi:hypothetical protein